MEKAFRNLAINYEIDINKDLYYKFHNINKDNSQHNKSKSKEDYELFKVPFVKNLFNYILNIHKDLNHRAFETIR